MTISRLFVDDRPVLRARPTYTETLQKPVLRVLYTGLGLTSRTLESLAGWTCVSCLVLAGCVMTRE